MLVVPLNRGFKGIRIRNLEGIGAMKLVSNSQRILYELFVQEYQDNITYTDESEFLSDL